MENLNYLGINSLLNSLDPALWVITSRDGARQNGMIATFVSPASIVYEEPRMVAGIARHHYTHELVEVSGVMALHLIHESQLDWVWRFGTQSGRNTDKLVSLETRKARTGSPILDEAIGWLDCEVETKMNAGDRTVYVLKVVDGGYNLNNAIPLTVKRMRTLAPPEKLNRLAQLLKQDGIIDEQNINDWRKGLIATG
jgi:flavin reductase (DIM6/NTAB) family NADH-FMN oxidoreductase RutF